MAKSDRGRHQHSRPCASDGFTFHAAAAKSITQLAEGPGAWAIPWPCMHELLVIVTSPQIYNPPTAVDVALEVAEMLRRSPSLVLLTETELHWQTLSALIAVG